MKKLFLIVVLALSYMGLSAQSVDDWFPNRTKVNFKDSTNFAKTPLINGVDTAATLRDVRAVGGGSIDMSLVRVEIGDSINALRPFIIYVVDTADMLAPYVREAEVTAITDLKLNVADTTNMLSKYIRIADTLDMLDPYLLKIDAADTYAPLASPTFTGTVTLPSATSIGDVNSTEIGYVNGVTSSIQTQLNSKVNVIDTSSMLAPYILDSKVQSDINDTITARLAGGTVGVALADSNDYAPYHYATPSFVKDLISTGGGGSLVETVLQFTVDASGAPSAGDSTLTHTDFTGNAIDIYRDGAKQYKNTTATNTVEGFRLNTNTITVNPVFQANEQIIVSILDPVTRTYVSLEGEESVLLDGLVAYYKFDETSGTSLTDEIGGNTATLNGDINQTGIINQAVGLTANNDDIVIPYSEGVTLGESEQFSVSMWFYAEDLPSTIGRGFMLFQQNNSSSPLNPYRATIGSNTDKIYFTVNTDALSDINVVSADAITADAWHHVVFVCPGSGGSLQMWLDGVDVSTSAQTVNGNLRDGDQYLCVGNAYNAATTAFYGEIDEFAIYNKVLTESEILMLYNSGSGNQYPFE